jgi:hypothetical protein
MLFFAIVRFLSHWVLSSRSVFSIRVSVERLPNIGLMAKFRLGKDDIRNIRIIDNTHEVHMV